MTRLLLIILLFLISLLTVFKAPVYYFWLLAIIVAEYPWIFTGITMLFLAAGFWVQKYQLTSSLIGLLALILFLSPVARAYMIAHSLKQNLTTAFGSNSAPEKGNTTQLPFTFWGMFAGNPHPVNISTFTYVTYPDTSLTLDFYPSKIPGNKPCVIVVHGGSWSSGDSKQLPELNSYLANKGYHVAAINYRLAPKYQSPAPVADVKAALNYLRSHAEELKIDTNNFVLLGRSAGAQIAMLAAYTLRDKGLKAVVDFYGPADMVWGYSVPANPLIMDSRLVMRRYLDGSYQHVPQNYAASSPIAFVSRLTVPTLIIHGENDVLVAYEHSRRLNAKLQENGIKHFWLQLPWATHGFDYNINGPGGQLSTYTVERFLKAVTQ
ncbi:MAG: alpha/beta hydrolase [Mucilaginibacter sp.]|nr:alpha/beta hydrolase [Mucilaginibacter sp.]